MGRCSGDNFGRCVLNWAAPLLWSGSWQVTMNLENEASYKSVVMTSSLVVLANRFTNYVRFEVYWSRPTFIVPE
ncbi:hypothetical protein TRIUR3_30256 [Triticum urartu]|uniref:Uncharacterized protein n=1 Tax=Triticum urartu TaxID=4572 RepID=M8A508_TRIUA|nr:hypothetical protein TRIUR3_30256 [Triticum urartu]